MRSLGSLYSLGMTASFFSSLSWLGMTGSSFGCLPPALRPQLNALWDDSLGLANLVRSVCRQLPPLRSGGGLGWGQPSSAFA